MHPSQSVRKYVSYKYTTNPGPGRYETKNFGGFFLKTQPSYTHGHRRYFSSGRIPCVRI